jgi:acetyltransferase-like isoleucine patch superfamily enzyme
MSTIHHTAEVSADAQIGEGTQVWHQAHVREGASLGRNCIVGKGVYIDFGVQIGDNCKLQNGAMVYHGVELQDGVFVGPCAILSNDRFPRAINPDGTLKEDADWRVGHTLVKRGASLGAGSIVLPGLTIGAFALVGAGSVVTKDVPDMGLVIGNPSRLAGYVCRCGRRLQLVAHEDAQGRYQCPSCHESYLSPLLHQEEEE